MADPGVGVCSNSYGDGDDNGNASDGLGDDFDDFAEGEEMEGDDDFGDFDDEGFEQTAEDQSAFNHDQSSTPAISSPSFPSIVSRDLSTQVHMRVHLYMFWFCSPD